MATTTLFGETLDQCRARIAAAVARFDSAAFPPGTRVGAGYRDAYPALQPWLKPATPHRGTVLAANDPAAWAGSIAFPRPHVRGGGATVDDTYLPPQDAVWPRSTAWLLVLCTAPCIATRGSNWTPSPPPTTTRHDRALPYASRYPWPTDSTRQL